MTPSPLATLPAPPAVVPSPLAMQVLDLLDHLPGFPGYRDYVLVPADGLGRLYWLQSVAPGGPRFLAVRAVSYFPDYAPALPPAVGIELGTPGEVQLYCLVSMPDGNAAAATANLRAPVVVNQATGRARQVVLTDGAHPIRRPMRR